MPHANPIQRQPNRPAARTMRWFTLRLVRACACLAAMAALAGAQQQTPNLSRPIPIPVITVPPDPNQQMEMHEQAQKDKSANFAAANAERKKQISDDSARLLKLATELKEEVDNTTKDTLSVAVIRKADEIERLAHNVKQKMKLTVGKS